MALEYFVKPKLLFGIVPYYRISVNYKLVTISNYLVEFW